MELSTKPQIALLSSPAHFTPMFELGKRLVMTIHNLKVTIFLPCLLESAAAMSAKVESTQATNKLNIDVILLPPADISGLIKPDQRGIAVLPTVVRVSKPDFRSAISALQTPATALIVHVYAVDCLEIADELKIPKFVYVSSNAWYLALLLYLPVLDKDLGGEFEALDKDQQFVLPGCSPVRAEDLPDPIRRIQTKNNYLEVKRMGMEIPKAKGILVNTWEELQPRTLAALREEKLLGSVAKAPIFPIGPIIEQGSKVTSKSESDNLFLFEWLDKQPNESVLYIAFGSMGKLSLEQMTELAWGLEMSQQRFIWVVRPPIAKPGIEQVEYGNDISSYLPQGFMSRTQNRGMVVPQWAPQVQILSHPSCGGFFTHCGWNSAMECITNGLPMIAWPLYAEQRMNATMLTEELGIAVRSNTMPTMGVVVGREEIETMIKKIFVDEQGRTIRGRVKELKLSAEKAWTMGGSSYNALAAMVKRCNK